MIPTLLCVICMAFLQVTQAQLQNYHISGSDLQGEVELRNGILSISVVEYSKGEIYSA